METEGLAWHVPQEYHHYEDIFGKKDFDKLPEQGPWDHAIELTPGSKLTDCKTYPLSPQEQGSLQEFIEENLKTGRIRPSKSPLASPFFFVKKKMEVYALLKIIENLMTSLSRIAILYPY